MTDFSNSKPGQMDVAGDLDSSMTVADVGLRLSYIFGPLLAGCATMVIPPNNPVDPVTVYIADYGKHSSLFLPTQDNGYEEFAIGDWDFLVMGKTNLWVAIRAMVRSPQATLGRRRVEVVNPQSTGSNRVVPVRVARQRAAALSKDLDDRFNRSPVPPYFSSNSMLHHIPDPEPYWGLNNCNHVTAEWLRRIGCQVQGPSIWSNFMLADHR